MKPDIEITADMKRFFFDRESVKAAIGAVSASRLSRIGSYIQRKARSLIRRRKKTSQPGQPPSAHSADTVATIKNIWFAYDPQTQSVVVGPLKLNGSSRNYVVPETLEFGGTVTRPGGRRATYKARPYMNPAYQAELENPKLMEVWRNSVRAN